MNAIRRVTPSLLVLPSVLFLAAFLIFPVFQLLSLSVIDDQGSATLDNYRRVFSVGVYLHILWTTLKTGLIACVLCLLIGYPLAYLLSTADPRSRSILLVWVLIPLWTSFLVRAISWMIILGRNGVINQTLQSAGLGPLPFEMIYNFVGVMIGTVHGLMPMAVLTMYAVMRNIDMSLPRAAETLGARPAEAFWLVYFPISAPGAAGAALLVFVAALGYFVAPQLLGGPRDTMIAPLIILQLEQSLNFGFAGALSLLLLCTSLLVIFGFNKLFGLSSLMGSPQSAEVPKRWSGSRSGNPVLLWLGRSSAALVALASRRAGKGPSRRPVLWSVSLAAVVFLAAPALFLIPTSFTESPFLSWPPKGFTLDWYRFYFESPVWQAATWRSIWIGCLSAALSMTLGIPAATYLARYSFRLKPVVITILLLPLILPEMIIAVPLFALFSQIGLVGTNLGLIIGHSIFGLPYVVVTLLAVLRNYDYRLDHASWTLGAGKLRTFRTITLPLIAPGVATAFLFAFIKSFDELTVAMFIAGGTMTTLPRELWASAQQKVDPSLAAVACVMLAIIVCALGVSHVIQKLSSKRK